MAASEDVSLPDLQVIQRYSLAVRGATARRSEVIEALQADLDWLTRGSAPAAKKAPVAKKAAAPKSGVRRG